MVTGPVIFLTVSGGIAGADSLRRVGRVGVKALVYFQAATLVSLGLGLLAANVFQPGVGVHGVIGAGFVILAATLSVLGTLPAAGIMPVFGVDKFLSECRALTNVCGNTIASMVVARWEGRLDSAEVRRRLAAKPAGPVPAEVPEPRPEEITL
jgi:aerobic C4-dicarboxylate transport protein